MQCIRSMPSLACCLSSPFVLCFHSFRVYVFPCVKYYTYKIFCCVKLFRTCFLYEDNEFNDKALGTHFEKDKNSIVWKRCYDMKGYKFISDHIEPSDIIQGGVGDCWLISAISCLAEHHGVIHNLFEHRDVSVYGVYTVRLYNKSKKQWEKITVDDKIPCNKTSGKPMFAQSKNEIWPLILEKAFAKFVGDYSLLKGGCVAWALQAMTGDQVMKFAQTDRVWQKQNMITMINTNQPQTQTQTQTQKGVGFIGSSEKYTECEMFEIFKEYDKQNSMLAAYILNNSEWKKSNGIVAGHAYSILRVEEIGNVKLLQLRNPWGRFEWNGMWSDKSDMWDKHPYVKMRLGNTIKDDGTFWIDWYNFQSIFTDVDVCHRSTGLNDLVLDIHEDIGCCGPVVGCTKGCCGYWCCCNGCKAIYYQTKSSQSTLKVKKKSCAIL